MVMPGAMMALFGVIVVFAAHTDARHTFGKATTTSVLIDHTDVSNQSSVPVAIGDSLVYFVQKNKLDNDDIFLVQSNGKNISLKDLAGQMRQPGKRGMTGYAVKGDFKITNTFPGFTRNPFYIYAVSSSQVAVPLVIEVTEEELHDDDLIADFLPNTTTFMSASQIVPINSFYLSTADQVAVYPSGYDATDQVLPVLKMEDSRGAYESGVKVLSPIATIVYRGLSHDTARIGYLGDEANNQKPNGEYMYAGGSYTSMSQGFSGNGQNYPARNGFLWTAFVAYSPSEWVPVPVLAVQLHVTHSSPNKNDLLRVVSYLPDGGHTEHLFSGEVSGNDGELSIKASEIFVHWNSATPDASYLVRIDTAENSAVTGGFFTAIAVLLLWLRL